MKNLKSRFSEIIEWLSTKKCTCILSCAFLLILADVFYLKHQFAYKEARLEQLQAQYIAYEESLLKSQKAKNAYLPQAVIKSQNVLDMSEILISLFSNKGAGLNIQELRLFNSSQENLNADYNGQPREIKSVDSLPNTILLHGSIDMKRILNPYELLNQKINEVEIFCSCKPRLTKALVDSKYEGASPYSRFDYNVIIDLDKCAMRPPAQAIENDAYSGVF